MKLSRRSILAGLAALALPWRKAKPASGGIVERPSWPRVYPHECAWPPDSFVGPCKLRTGTMKAILPPDYSGPIIIHGYTRREGFERDFLHDFGRAQAEKFERELFGPRA